jgi:two-component system sensor histidine kinase CiaH
MFESARIKLTLWYLLIIMAISVAFSTFIYFRTTDEFDRILRVQRYRIEHPAQQLQSFGLPNNIVEIQPLPLPDPDVIQDAKLRVLMTLISINSIIFILSSLAAYFLAGRTLKPIQRMMDEQQRFISDASHELTTPLTSLKTSIEVNLRDKKLNLEKAKKILESNLEEVDRLQALSEELLTLEQYQKKSIISGPSTITVKDIVETAYERIQPLAEKKQITIVRAVPSAYVLGNDRSLIELFVILLDNAIKYSPSKTTVAVTSEKADGKIKILVTDEGIGIEEKDIPHIFDRFYRADKSRTQQSIKGYGLGLSIAKKIVENSKGSICVKSTSKKGTTFTLSLQTTK